MITVRVFGGLGNQLFQYALGRALELDKSVRRAVQFDPSPLDLDPCRCYLLDKLGLHLPIGKTVIGQQVWTEPSLRFHPEVLKMNGPNLVLHGYWQCERYFGQVQDEIRAEVFRNMPASGETLRMSDRIQRAGRRSCFVHIRRTDNTNPRNKAVHGLIGPDYLDAAVDKIRSEVEGAEFFAFSDDVRWAKRWATPYEDVTVIDWNPMSGSCDEAGVVSKRSGGAENQDLWLMSQCHHGIVGNSTFSWWAAWLNPFEKTGDRVVIAPHAWFNPQQTRNDATDILPDRWTRL